MNPTILVAGGTGNLGGRIIQSLLHRGAEVRAVVRPGSDTTKLEWAGITVIRTDMTDVAALSTACRGVACAVSVLQGLEEVIVGVQSALLDAAVAAGVPRFIPSDYSVDFTPIPGGANRNFDLRRAFHKRLQAAPIAATSVFNGAFADILTYGTPLLDVKKKMIGYWGDDPDWRLDFTTMDETAAFTAAAAMDRDTPASLHIASFGVSPRELSALTGFNLVRMGSLEELDAYNRQQRATNPEGEKEVTPRWQQGHYIHDMFATHHERLDNGRYPHLKWTDAASFIGSIR